MKMNFSRLILIIAIPLLAVSCRTVFHNADSTERIKGPADKPLRTNNAYGHRPRYQAYNARVSRGKADLIFIGDSITQRWDGHGLSIWEGYYSHRNALNLGIDGDRTQNVLWRLENGNIDGISPKVAVVMIGTNNASDGDSAEVIAGGIIAVCNKIRQKLPETKILLMGIFPRGEKPCEIRERNAMAGRIASKIADGKMVRYMDISEQFIEPDGSISKEVMYDYVHLTSRGYKIWAKALEPKLKELLDEKHTTTTASHRYSGWALRHESLNDRAECGYVDLVFIGDSITEKWETHGEYVWEKYYAKRKAINLGISGDRTQNVLWRLKNGNINGLSPKAAVVMIGTNNLSGNRNTPEETAEGVKAICDLLREKLPDTKILLLGIFPREEKPGELRAKVKAANDIISKIGDGRMIHYLDIGEKFIQSDGTISREIMGDFLHLTPKGYQIWAESIEPKLAELMGE